MSVVLIVGPGDRFLSGISYCTALLATALGEGGPVAVLQLRRLCPRACYPGRARVGENRRHVVASGCPDIDGLDWFWGLSALRAWCFWRRIRLDVLTTDVGEGVA